MKSLDSYYTPPSVADKLVQLIPQADIKNIADFCVGNGDLLKSAEKRWPNSKFLGLDISKNAINNLQKENNNWVLSKCDFLNPRSRNKSKVLSEYKRGFDLILLNPPFSCIGSTIHQISINDNIFTVSTSMKFLIESVKYLKKEGVLYAIMPTSVAYSQKDRKAWDFLKKHFYLKVIEKPNNVNFKGCTPNIVFISINDKSSYSVPIGFNNISNEISFPIEITRGKVSMYQLSEQRTEGAYVVHSTNLQDNEIINLRLKSISKTSIISGPAVLLPRVGKPIVSKIAVIPKEESFVISDCIIAIRTQSNDTALTLRNILIENWDILKDLYKGTGAKYITIERLKEFLGVNKSL
jgi:type I restriction-modification system DNA methylase subunit